MRASLLRLLHRPTLLGPNMARLRRSNDLRPRRTLHLHGRKHIAHHAASPSASPQKDATSCAATRREEQWWTGNQQQVFSIGRYRAIGEQ
jgi:hypothetical protein